MLGFERTEAQVDVCRGVTRFLLKHPVSQNVHKHYEATVSVEGVVILGRISLYDAQELCVREGRLLADLFLVVLEVIDVDLELVTPRAHNSLDRVTQRSQCVGGSSGPVVVSSDVTPVFRVACELSRIECRGWLIARNSGVDVGNLSSRESDVACLESVVFSAGEEVIGRRVE